jgi:hypothetical protein
MEKRVALGKGYISPNLTVTVKKWGTPTANNYKQEGDNVNIEARSEKGGCLPSQARFTQKQWTTPVARDKKGSSTITKNHPDGFNNNLVNDVTKWPTPTARDYKGANNEETTMDKLDRGEQAHMGQLANFAVFKGPSRWKSPTANEDAARKPGANMQQMLKQQAEVEAWNIHTGHQAQVPKKSGLKSLGNTQNLPQQWKTPTTMDTVTNRDLENQKETRDSLGNAELSREMMGKKMRLNPFFVEWLMGKPVGWSLPTPLDPSVYKHWEMVSAQLLEQLHSGFSLKD